MVPDPKDPTCCKMPECPLIPPGGTTPAGPTIIRPPQPTAVIINFPTPGPQLPVTQSPPLGPDGHTLAPPLGSTKAPTPRTGEFIQQILSQALSTIKTSDTSRTVHKTDNPLPSLKKRLKR